MNYNSDFFKALPTLSLAILFVTLGIIMAIKNQVVVGINSRTMQFSAVGGYLLIFVGIIFLAVSYFSLSPFGKIRRFFEGVAKKHGKNK